VRLVLLGPPGAGKGTQAKRLSSIYHVQHVATGDIFRWNVQAGTELGQLAKKFMDAGELVPDDVTLRIVVDALERAPSGYVLDGFPRTIAQAEALERELTVTGHPLSAVLALVVDEDLAVKRIAGRRTCASCQRPYNVALDPPREAGVCDVCGGPLVQRPDDDEEVARRRLEIYRESTAPLLKFYSERGLLREIDGAGTEEEVTQRALQALRDIHGDN
jgi:adenylate kinase